MKKTILFLMLISFVMSISAFSAVIKVTAPNGGENWDLGSTQNVTWTSSGVSGNVGIKLFHNGRSLGYVAQNIPVGSGSYSWTISTVIGVGAISAGSNYQIQVKQSGVAGDKSDGNFVIGSRSTPAASITVNSPNGGENWEIGSTHNVTWSSSGVSGNVGIKLFHNGSSLGYIAQNIPVASGSYSWTISNIIGGGAIAAGSNYKIQVKQSGVAGNKVFGNSAAFQIEPKKKVKPPLGTIDKNLPVYDKNAGNTLDSKYKVKPFETLNKIPKYPIKNPKLPKIIRFKPWNDLIEYGKKGKLHLDVINAEKISVKDSKGKILYKKNNISGSEWKYDIDVDLVNSTTEFILEAVNQNGAFYGRTWIKWKPVIFEFKFLKWVGNDYYYKYDFGGAVEAYLKVKGKKSGEPSKRVKEILFINRGGGRTTGVLKIDWSFINGPTNAFLVVIGENGVATKMLK